MEEIKKCKNCNYGKIVEKHWKEEYLQKKATIIIQSVTMTLSVTAIIINLMCGIRMNLIKEFLFWWMLIYDILVITIKPIRKTLIDFLTNIK